jgi:hypothetical protein
MKSSFSLSSSTYLTYVIKRTSLALPSPRLIYKRVVFLSFNQMIFPFFCYIWNYAEHCVILQRNDWKLFCFGLWPYQLLMEELSFLKVCGPFRTVQQFKKILCDTRRVSERTLLCLRWFSRVFEQNIHEVYLLRLYDFFLGVVNLLGIIIPAGRFLWQ